MIKPIIFSETRRLILSEALVVNREDYGANTSPGLVNEWVLLDFYFEKPWLLSESAHARAQVMIEGMWDGFVGLAKAAGGKVVDAGKWVADTVKNMGKEAAAIVKKLGGKIADVFAYLIKQLPGGEVVLEFLSTVGANLGAKIKEMGAAVKDKITEWAKTAKKKLLDFFLNTLFKEDEALRKHLYGMFGLEEEQVEKAAEELKEMNIVTITELNWALSVKGLLSEGILREQEEESNVKKAAKAGATAKTVAGEAESALKVFGALENTGKDAVDPVQWMRGKAGQVIEKIFEVFADLVKKSPLKYLQPLFDSDFFEPFQTGFGLASSAFMGILSSGELAWNTLVEYINAILNGFKLGSKEQRKGGREVRTLFTKDGASLLKDMMVGLVTGSNIEVIVRALAGDATQIAEAVKRLTKTLIEAVKQAIKEKSSKVVQDASEGDVSAEAEEEVTGALDDYVDDMFAA